MYYLITVPAKGFLMQMETEHLETFRNALSEADVPVAFAKVGGGLVLIVRSQSPAHLMAELRKHQILDAEVTPIVPLASVIDGYLEHKTSGRVGHELVS